MQNFFNSISNNFTQSFQRLSTESAPFMDSIRSFGNSFASEEFKSFHYKKGPGRNGETPNNRFESLFSAKKYKEAGDFFMLSENAGEIKTYTFNSFIDKLFEGGFVDIFTDLLSHAIQKNLSVLTKYTMKKYFGLLGKINKMNYGD